MQLASYQVTFEVAAVYETSHYAEEFIKPCALERISTILGNRPEATRGICGQCAQWCRKRGLWATDPGQNFAGGGELLIKN